jgi:hypothetical protein
MRRQLLAPAAITTTIIGVAFAAPAYADHEDPRVVALAPDATKPSCADIGIGPG